MAKYFVIGESGESELWLIDIDSRTVTPVTEAALKAAADADTIQIIGRARKDGFTVAKGINIAIASGTRTGAKANSYIESD